MNHRITDTVSWPQPFRSPTIYIARTMWKQEKVSEERDILQQCSQRNIFAKPEPCTISDIQCQHTLSTIQ
jgi:hypothetical protein